METKLLDALRNEVANKNCSALRVGVAERVTTTQSIHFKYPPAEPNRPCMQQKQTTQRLRCDNKQLSPRHNACMHTQKR